MNKEQQLQDFFNTHFPDSPLVVEKVGNKQGFLRREVTNSDLRPGGTVSGPFMMGLVDAALYATILGEIGLVALAVTTNLNINFLSKPVADADVLAECTLLKLGSKLAVGEVTLYSEGMPEPIAHAVGTYSIPPVSNG